MLPRNLHRAAKTAARSIRVSPLLAELAAAQTRQQRCNGSAAPLEGLSEEEAARRLERHGPNVVASDERSRTPPTVPARRA